MKTPLRNEIVGISAGGTGKSDRTKTKIPLPLFRHPQPTEKTDERIPFLSYVLSLPTESANKAFQDRLED